MHDMRSPRVNQESPDKSRLLVPLAITYFLLLISLINVTKLAFFSFIQLVISRAPKNKALLIEASKITTTTQPHSAPIAIVP